MAPPSHLPHRPKHNISSSSSAQQFRVSKVYSRVPQGRTHNIKGRMRDIERKLRNAEKLPANLRVDMERELDSLSHEHAVNRAEDARFFTMKKYKMVRFVESQKALRRLKKATSALQQATSEEEKSGLERALHIAQIDANYTQYYPMSEPYVGIFPREQEQLDEGRERKGDLVMWDRVEKATADGTLEQLKNELVVKQELKKHDPKEQKLKKDGDVEEDGDSDGGFFE